MKPSLRSAIEWIAQNDNSGNGDSEEEIAGYVSTALIADLFNKDQNILAKKIANKRQELGGNQ
mgnify:CR=1 FL=1